MKTRGSMTQRPRRCAFLLLSITPFVSPFDPLTAYMCVSWIGMDSENTLQARSTCAHSILPEQARFSIPAVRAAVNTGGSGFICPSMLRGIHTVDILLGW